MYIVKCCACVGLLYVLSVRCHRLSRLRAPEQAHPNGLARGEHALAK